MSNYEFGPQTEAQSNRKRILDYIKYKDQYLDKESSLYQTATSEYIVYLIEECFHLRQYLADMSETEKVSLISTLEPSENWTVDEIRKLVREINLAMSEVAQLQGISFSGRKPTETIRPNGTFL